MTTETAHPILITEVNFKNSNADWLTIRYSKYANGPINLQGFSFADDKIFKTIEEDFIIAPGQTVLLTFNEEKNDTMPYLFTKQKGLTGTTEQVILYDAEGVIVDALCWANENPTTTEQDQQVELFEQDGWHSPQGSSCFFSPDVTSNTSVIRISENEDTNSINDWQIRTEEITFQQEIMANDLSPQKIEQELPPNVVLQQPLRPLNTIAVNSSTVIPELVAVDLPLIEPISTDEENNTKTGEKNNTDYQDGDVSSQVIITEIMPNPDGNDSGNEWIELTNQGGTSINLGNWQLDDEEDGSKPYTFSDEVVIEPYQQMIISNDESKIALGNTEDTVRLFDFNGVLIDSITYQEASSGKSYSLISIINRTDTTPSRETNWLWTGDITPQNTNPEYEKVIATITSPPTFSENYSFRATINGQEQTFTFDEGIIAGPIAKATFQPGSIGEFTIERQDENTAHIQKYHIQSALPNSEAPTSLIPSFLMGFLFLIVMTFFIIKKKITWKNPQVL